MFVGTYSFGFVVASLAIMFMVFRRLKSLPYLATCATTGSVFGLLILARYAILDHSLSAVLFSVSAGVIFVGIAVRHFQAYPPKA